ncbi:hypothetical protein BDA99DRAFT_540643 [Phascolomyces articulosus]|uniref:SH3 domain-containing protein n=1 Tax=Phascolomyces articulosus TaxID=60185 RepID=A0AAD5K6N0_9FUNG|nr:hypothetical protein BDA99DRAFT_540643 [Phascolomyces articulosus]
MLKNLVRIKQWTGERLGTSKPTTLQTEDLKELGDHLDEWHAGFETMYQTIKHSHAELAKTKNLIEDSRTKYTPMQAIGDAWHSHGKDIVDSSPKLGTALQNLGEAEGHIATYFDQLTLQLGTDYIHLLKESRTCYHKIVDLRRKLETRRLDYAAHLSRLQKAKKEKPQLEQVLQQSKMKFEDTQRELLSKMIDLEQYKEMHREALYNFMDLQIGCFLNAAKILQQVKESWPQGPEYDDEEEDNNNNNNDGDAGSFMNKHHSSMMTQTTTAENEGSIPYDRTSYSTATSKKRKSTDSAFEQSTIATSQIYNTDIDDRRRPSTVSNNNNNNEHHYLHPDDHRSFCSTSTGASSSSCQSTIAPMVPSMNNTTSSNMSDNNKHNNPLLHRSLSELGSQRSSKPEIFSASEHQSFSNAASRKQSFSGASSNKLRKALYSFPGDRDEDLAFKAGDIITVLEEINEGWWLGEVRDQQGHKHCGIFPLNYTAELETPEIASPPPPLPEKDYKPVKEPNVDPSVNPFPQEQEQKREQEQQDQKQNKQDVTIAKQDHNNNTSASIPNDASSTSQI